MSSEPNVNTVESAPRAPRSVQKPEHEPFMAAMPANATNWMSVWRRNYLVWKKLAIASMFGNLADPMIYLFGLGFGLGLMVATWTVFRISRFSRQARWRRV